nr:MAG TPA: hypothetical protein [Caudoviricetes sp.]
MKCFQRNAHTDIQQRVRTLTLDLLNDSFVHTLPFLCGRCIVDLVRSTAIIRLVQLQLTLYLGNLGKCQFTTQIGQDGTIGNSHRLTAHKINSPFITHFHQVGRGFPAGIIAFRTYKRAAAGCRKILIVQLDQVERGADCGVLGHQGEYRGVRNLFGIHINAFGLCAAPVPGAFFYITDDYLTFFHTGYPVNKILVHVISVLERLIICRPPARPQRRKSLFEQGKKKVQTPLNQQPFPPRSHYGYG